MIQMQLCCEKDTIRMGGNLFSKPKPKPAPAPVVVDNSAQEEAKARAERERLKRLGAAGTRVGVTDALSVQRKSLLGE